MIKNMNRFNSQMFTGEFDSNAYCDFSAVAANATAGKDLLLAIWNAEGTSILAVAGQQGLTINRSAETIEVNTKDTEGSWKAAAAGAKSWSIDVDGVYVASDNSHKILGQAFEDGDLVCVKVYNNKTHKGMFAGLACITDYPIEAPYDDSVTYSITLQGVGKLTDFSIETVEHDTLPA